MKSYSRDRLIVKGTLNGRGHYFLLDSGAVCGILSRHLKGLRLSTVKVRIMDASGDTRSCYTSNDFVTIGGRRVAQFVVSDFSDIQHNIREQTGIWIDGIIGLTQMQMLGLKIDFSKMEIT
ncbi:hypothetical protein C7120_01775 [Prevotella sp. oral taxon 376]|uniref:hypothetical protein n=1 Tax=Prevotella sp. oral taxon 376 TaxID=712466 RepID=UPI000D1E05A0|nr:hypothetical protein [Prevotella sp. oral taxon 376]PTL33375.1 hypothetical protein C7120_01775 [Prevotella sp. oral taxon 376]